MGCKNAGYSYDESGLCEIANLTFLENPGPGQIAKQVMVNINEAYNLPMYCRGGYHCCNKDTNCTVGDGDCNRDEDCPGVLICGKNNCMTGENIARSLLVNKGLWDPDDDCCERACTPEHPCQEGGGTCNNDADCWNPGWAKCGAACLNTTYFPTSQFIKNTVTHGFASGDSCCYRVCNKRYNICGNNQVGCWNDEDCAPGLYCKRNVAQPFCTDIDECDPTNGKFLGTKYCGMNTVCTNTIGSFTCTCNAEYENFTAWVGCADIDECSKGTSNCHVATADCWNTPGSFVCNCKLGLIGNPITGCTDVDECSSPTLNNCIAGARSPVYNSETFGGENIKFFSFGKGPDSYSITVKVEVSGPSAASLSLCDGASSNSCYELVIGASSNTQMVLRKCKRATPLQCITMATVTHSTAADIALHAQHFRTFWFQTKLNATRNLIISAGSASDAASISFQDINPISCSHVGLMNSGYQETIYWRNLRTDRKRQTCTNTFGSYVCTDNDEELAAIGFGGYTTNQAEYRNELIIVSDKKDSCGNHLLPSLQGRFSPGSAVVGNRLYICGGNYYGAFPMTDCRSINLDTYSPAWIASPALPQARGEFVMVAYLTSFYAIGGRGSACLASVHEFNATKSAWTTKASLPTSLNRHCGVSDVTTKNIWILGGFQSCASTTNQVLSFNVTTNVWSTHSLLPWPTGELSCGIVTKTTGKRWLLAVGGGIGVNSVAYLDITYSNSTIWTTVSSLAGNMQQWRMVMVSPTPYSAYLLGGDTQRFGVNLRNFWEFNKESNVFEDGMYYLQNEMYSSAWAMTKKSYKALQNCFSYVTYAAVGWGGKAWLGQWDVLLRSRTMAGDSKLPARCDTAIPDLDPPRAMCGITAVGYRLMVCGGFRNGYPEDALCYWLDTNSNTPVWSSMSPMPSARAWFQLITYGDAMFAIGGWRFGRPTNLVDRWTLAQGWVNMANYPTLNTHRYCAVADEGYDAIYVMGGQVCTPGCWVTRQVFKYTISTDKWSGFAELPWNRQDGGCGITYRRTDGHRWMIHAGHDWGAELAYYDLTINSGWEAYGGLTTHWARSRWISLTPYESLLAGGYTGSHGASTR
jgi:hypothetical protein